MNTEYGARFVDDDQTDFSLVLDAIKHHADKGDFDGQKVKTISISRQPLQDWGDALAQRAFTAWKITCED